MSYRLYELKRNTLEFLCHARQRVERWLDFIIYVNIYHRRRYRLSLHRPIAIGQPVLFHHACHRAI